MVATPFILTAYSLLLGLNNGVVDGAIFNALATAGSIAFRLIDHTDLTQVIDCLTCTKMDAGSASDTLFHYDHVCLHRTPFRI